MGPNDVELVRIYPREAGTLVEDITLEIGSNFDVVVDGEVGDALFGTGGSFTIDVIIRDLSANSTVIHTANVSSNFGAAWATVKEDFVFVVPAAVINGRENHIMEALALLSAGGIGPQNPPDVSFVRSRLFTAHQP
ncbi:MAG: hypothetical protein IT320_25870 [Anaerolineae bacterium]|nr:hypothetical protein [Anaerolineae bacterium]